MPKTCKRCGAGVIWATTTKGNWCSYDCVPVLDGVRFVLSDDDPAVAYATVVGEGHAIHLRSCPGAVNPDKVSDDQEGFDFD